MRHNRKTFFIAVLGVIATIVVGFGVGRHLSAEEAAQGAATGSIKGVIKFEGEAPKSSRLNMNADPVCAGAHSSPVMGEEVVLGANSELANVIVYITDGVTGEFPTPTEAVVMDQKGCMYQPHVFGLFDGQKLEIRNSDKTLHNVHCYKGTSTCFNRAMFQGMAPISHEFKEHGDIVRFKCDVHPWMTAYALVATNPFFATSGADGTFEIKNVPAGTYTVKAWHEKLGEQTMQITVTAAQPASADFTFKAGS